MHVQRRGGERVRSPLLFRDLMGCGEDGAVCVMAGLIGLKFEDLNL